MDQAIMILDLFYNRKIYIKSRCSITLKQKDLHKTVLIVGVKLFICTLPFSLPSVSTSQLENCDLP